MAFPATPTDGQKHNEGGTRYRYVAASSAWVIHGGGNEHRETISGTGAQTTFTITHNLDLEDGMYGQLLIVRDSNNDAVEVDVRNVAANSLDLVFDVAPGGADDFRVLVKG